MTQESAMPDLKSYRVWDLPTRWFHWINVLCVFALAGFGLVILNAGALEISNAGKILLKTLHVWAGYVFVLNLAVRIVWAFFGNHHARWRQILPGGRGYFRRLRSYVASFAAGHPEPYLGHNPLGRIAVAGLLLVMIVQASTGLLLAGSDIYFPLSVHGLHNGSQRPASTLPRWCRTRPRCTTRPRTRTCDHCASPSPWSISTASISCSSAS